MTAFGCGHTLSSLFELQGHLAVFFTLRMSLLKWTRCSFGAIFSSETECIWFGSRAPLLDVKWLLTTGEELNHLLTWWKKYSNVIGPVNILSWGLAADWYMYILCHARAVRDLCISTSHRRAAVSWFFWFSFDIYSVKKTLC